MAQYTTPNTSTHKEEWKNQDLNKDNKDGKDLTTHQEGKIAKTIEAETTKLPSDLFLWSAGGAALGALTLQVLGKRETSNFIGQWVPTLLILGLYNKLVKVAGSEGETKNLQSKRSIT